MEHKRIIESIEAWPNSPNPVGQTRDAVVALYRLLEERLPAAPMTVIESAPAPVEDEEDIPVRTKVDDRVEYKTFKCDLEPRDWVGVNHEDAGDRVFITLDVDVSDPCVGLTRDDAVRFANAVLDAAGYN